MATQKTNKKPKSHANKQAPALSAQHQTDTKPKAVQKATDQKQAKTPALSALQKPNRKPMALQKADKEQNKTMALLATDPDHHELDDATSATLKQVTRGYLERKAKKEVRIVVLADARRERPGETILKGKGRGIIRHLKACIEAAGKKSRVVGYRFRTEFQATEVYRAKEHLRRPGTIVVVLGGNTFHLTSALSRVPSFRKLLISRVKEGKVMYVGYSAGSMLAGTDISHSRGRRPAKPNLKGLGLVAYKLNPHANQRSTQGRPGVKIVDGKALFFAQGKKQQVV